MIAIVQHTATALLLLTALCNAPVAGARPTVIITVDVESRAGLPLPDQVHSICVDGSRCGIMQIARMLEERHLAGTFFLNVYEYQAWGKPALRAITEELQRRGHDVALHTHPQLTYDATRPNMYEYSLDEQTRIVKEGAELLLDWTGLPVVAHRAGTYSADRNTLEALERNGIRFDSSWFLEHPNSRLAGMGLKNNLPSIVGQVSEIPVTVYAREERPRFLQSIAPPLSSVRKLDPNWFLDEHEAIAALDAVSATDTPFLIFFLHSYSLIAENGDDERMVLDAHAKALFSAMLDYIVAKRLPVTTFRALAESTTVIPNSGRDVVPGVAVATPALNYLSHAVRARIPVFATGAAAVIILVLVLVRFRTNRTQTPT